MQHTGSITTSERFWEWVKAKGTGFFGRPMPQHWDAREGASGRMNLMVDELDRLGADRNLLRAAILYLAEVAAEWNQVQDSYRLSKSRRTIVLSRRREALKRVKRFRQSIETFREEWPQLKGAVEPNVLELPGEANIDDALSTLISRIENYLYAYAPQKEKKSKGRPKQDDFLRILSGIARHLELTVGEPIYSRLFKLTSVLILPLPIARTEDQLRSGVHAYRRRKRTTGDSELQALEGEFERLRKKFEAATDIYNV